MGYKLKKIYIHTPNTTHNLPSEYQEVEYIESSGTSCGINTGITPHDTNFFEIDFKMNPTVLKSGGNYFYGASSSSVWHSFEYTSGNSSYWNVGSSTLIGTLSPNLVTGTDYIFDCKYDGNSNGTLTVSGTYSKSVSYSGGTGPNPLYFFCAGSGLDSQSAEKLYYMKIYTGNSEATKVLVRDFIPCYRKLDDEIGLYDLVNDQFYTNAGTGTFTKGADILPTIEHQVRPDNSNDFWYSDSNRNKYQSLVTSTGSVQFQDTGKRYRFNNACYIGNRIAVNVNSNTMTKVNLDTLTVTQTITLARTPEGKIWYFGDNRILTSQGIMDFNGNFVSTFSYRTIAPGLPGIVWTHDTSYNIYKGVVEGDNITFTKVGTGGTDQFLGIMCYGRLGAYLINGNDTSGNGYSTYVNPSTDTLTNFTGGSRGRIGAAVAGADGKLYRNTMRDNGWGRLQKIGTTDEGFVGDTLSTVWTAYGNRFGKFLGNIVTGGMNVNNGTGAGYGSNNYYIDTSGSLTKVQTDAFAYDTSINLDYGFIDENGLLYPSTGGGGTGVILKTDKTFTNLNWRNPFLWR